jgi:diguanylate cyclase (GGDEF)-like protein
VTQIEELRISGQLPTPKGVALAITELARRENVTLAEVARVVQTDPALSGRLIKLANTATQITRPVASVQEAVVRLGLNAVRQLALSFSLIDNYRDGACAAFDYDAYWSHSLLVALTVQELAARIRVAPPDELFACGLLAHVGRLALATAYPQEYDRILRDTEGRPIESLLALERQLLATDHVELSLVLLADWGLPEPLIDAVRHHEDPDAARVLGDSRIGTMAVMMRLAQSVGDLGLGAEDERATRIGPVLQIAGELDYAAGEAASLVDGVMARWREWGALLKVGTKVLPPAETFVPPPGTPAAGQPAPLCILVADGNEFSRRKLAGLLVQEGGHRVHVAADGREALALAMEVLPQVIIAQRDLGAVNGLELCQALRATDEGSRVFVLLLDDVGGDERLIEAFEAGVDEYAVQPVAGRVLCARLHTARRQVALREEWEKDRAQLRHIAAELAIANRRLATTALTDMLTGLPNRRSAMDQLEQAWSAAQRSGQPLSVMVIDIDGFKNVNDTYGHAAGDTVLREVAATLRASARKQDSVCRTGGEEFLVICPDTDLKAALQSAQRLRQTVAARPIAIDHTRLTMTVSVGIAEKTPETADTDAMVSRADQALYAAKNAGRNRTCVNSHGKIACLAG